MNESMCIIEYFEERFPDLPRLMPTDLYQKYQVRRLAEHCNCLVQPMANLGVLQEVEARFGKDARQPWGESFDRKNMGLYEAHNEKTRGKFCFGDEVTIADLFMLPQMYRCTRFDIDLKEAFPNTFEIHERLQELDFVKKSHAHACSDATL